MVDVQQLKTTQKELERLIANGDWGSKPSVPASTVEVQNPADFTMWVEIAGGTVTAVKVDNVTVGARTSGLFLVRPGSKISITYSVAPTWQWFTVV